VVYVFGSSVQFPIEDITPTFLTSDVLSTLRQADNLATDVLQTTNTMSKLSQMPVIIIPIHFDRDSVKNIPSSKRSIVIRPFITNDFMTGIAATPNVHFPAQVMLFVFNVSFHSPQLFRLINVCCPFDVKYSQKITPIKSISTK
jgi:GMP synthase (glutamine-hydrolysing)